MTEARKTGTPGVAGVASRPLDRRGVLKVMVSIVGLGVIGSILDACGAAAATPRPSVGVPVTASPDAPSVAILSPSAPTPSATRALVKEMTLASYLPLTDLLTDFTKSSGIAVKVNTVGAMDFGDRLDGYLAATPEDVFTSGAGFHMRSSAAKGLLTPIDDVWKVIGPNMPASLKLAATGVDGHQYAIPCGYYPWAVFYRKSVFAQHGYGIPTTWDAFKALAGQIRADGLIPIAMGNKERFPAMGTFDIINMRLNGYQFHIDLLAGKERWSDPRLTQVFLRWKELLPFTQSGAGARTWSDAAGALVNKEAGMYFFGFFFTGTIDQAGQSVLDDLDLFPFPRMGTSFDAENAIDGPADSFMIASRSPGLDLDLDNANAFLEYMAKGSSQISIASATGVVAASTDADTTAFSPLQRKASDLLSSAGRTAQFFDRDTDKAFAYGVGGFLQEFIDAPDQDLKALLGKIQATWPNS